MKYEMKQAVAPAGFPDEFDYRLSHTELGQLLKEGWEPFAVTSLPYTGNMCVWLRREVKE